MSKVELKIDAKEKEQLIDFFRQVDKDVLKATAEAISMMVRAFEGRPVEPDDIITRLTNVKNILERSRFPTYPLLAKQVYLRLIAAYNPSAQSCEKWANLEAEALISYKGQSRQEYTEQMKAASGRQEQQSIVFGPGPIAREPKRRFWQRKGKPPESEFDHE